MRTIKHRKTDVRLWAAALLLLLPAIGQEAAAGSLPENFVVHDEPRELAAASFRDGDGHTVSLTDFAGRVVLLNVWATWCGPCVEEMPVLRDAERQLGDQVVFLGINVQDAESNALDFLAELDVTYDQVRDPMAEYFTAVGGFGMPTTLLVDADGRIVYRHTGAIEADQLDDLLVDQLDVRT